LEISRKILIVDDEPSIISSLYSIISKNFNFDIHTASSGEEAISLLGENKKNYHLIISDYHMPNGSGLDLLKFIDSANIKSFFIMFSSSDEIKQHELHPKAIHIEKPDVQKLIDTISILT
jgi:YesN/AraC family two-component response regulator